MTKRPRSEVQEIKLTKKEWILLLKDGQDQHYDQAQILIHNVLFQLIQLSNPQRNKIIILFNDQIPSCQLRLLHLKQLKNSL